ncbi:uncharacterized protein LOC109061954 isoform X10 [Cyprinus carpio]|uniref:Uncharacterized protein LOC109061954 isoform X10 n=1 Tax=Cyprinus carpio TaxID=7962 RepID=A0A9Q9YD57_CYPCA|nr:uncharacterized protein LOC109061954 isoform X10 [Cyprinus carpio]XP_042618020.1 uncharacterized protein LOC109061954 isoform X10 [Cyprinus carpio]
MIQQRKVRVAVNLRRNKQACQQHKFTQRTQECFPFNFQTLCSRELTLQDMIQQRKVRVAVILRRNKQMLCSRELSLGLTQDMIQQRKVRGALNLRRNKQARQVILCQIMHLKRMMRTQECFLFNFQMLCSRELTLGLTQDMIQQRKVRVAVILRRNKQKRRHRFAVVLRPRRTLTLAQNLRETWTEKRAVNLREKKACQVILCQIMHLKRMMRTQECLPFNFQMLCSRELSLGLTQDMIQQRKVRVAVILRKNKQKRQHRFTVVLRPRTTLTLAQNLRETWTEKRAVNLREKKACQVILCQIMHLKRMMRTQECFPFNFQMLCSRELTLGLTQDMIQQRKVRLVVILRRKKRTQIRSSSETKKHSHPGTGPKRDMDREKGRKPERKGSSVESLPDNASKEDDGGSGLQEINKVFWTAAAVVLLAVVCALWQRSPDSTPPVQKEINVVDVFNQEMKKLETTFPNQHPELWRRSLIHLRRHLKTKNPTEPVSLILTSDHRAEKTLGCLAQCLARAFSTAHNTSVLNINGKNKTSHDSDQVKLDIDSELTKAFEGKKSAAVIHHFEELPPGSTLIFYRYCDHENAAYKDVFLVFTVMLDPEVELTSNDSLRRVGEMVKEHIKQKFVSSDKSAMFNQMDVDKLGGLWTRISHLILPVAAEKKIEKQGCGDCESPLNIQKPEEEDTASVIHEEDVERDENVQAQIIVPVNNKKTTDIHSSSETENHPQSGTGPKRDMDREKGRKPERKEGLSGDPFPDNAPKEDDDAVQQGTDSTGHDTTEKSESSSDSEEKQTGPSVDSLPDNAPKEDDGGSEKTTHIHSSSETENHPQSGTGPKRDMDREKGRKPERKEGLSGDPLPDNAPKEDDDAVQQGTDSTGHDTTEKSESSSDSEEKQTGLSVDSLPDNAPKEDDGGSGL